MRLEKTVLTLKSLSDTRWASRKQATEAVIQSLPAIIKALERIREHPHSAPKVASEADGLHTKLNTFEFIFMLVLWDELLKKTYTLSNYLQKQSLDINTAVELIDNTMSQIKRMRTEDEFKATEDSAKEIARHTEINTEFAEERVRKRKRHFDEKAEDEQDQDKRTRFKINVYFYILDVFLGQFEHRFKDFREMAKLFAVLSPRRFNLPGADKNILQLAQFYSEDISSPQEAVYEFASLCSLYKELNVDLSTDAVLPFLIANDMDRAFPHLAILYRIYKTIPISSATAERSFSRLKLIKNYLRSCMDEARLSHLTLLCLERDIPIDKDKVINRFAQMKQRKIKFQ